MRFCPFCSAENADEQAVCQACGRRLPPLPPRRARNAPPTGVQLPPRPNAAPPARKPSPPPVPGHAVAAAPVPAPTSGPHVTPHVVPRATPPAQRSGPHVAPAIPPRGQLPADRASAPSLPPPPSLDDDRRSLINAISPGPAAQRREAPLADPARDGRARRHSDHPPLEPVRGKPMSTPPPSVPVRGKPLTTPPGAPPPIVQSGPRTKPVTAPPPLAPSGARAKPMTAPPPIARQPTPQKPPTPPPSYPRASFEDDFNTMPSASAYQDPDTLLAPPLVFPEHERMRTPTGIEPPPTRTNRPEADRPFTPPKVLPIPEIPEEGLINAARYSVKFWQARWQRRGAIKLLGIEIKQDTEALDQVLGALGRVARNAKVDGRVFSAENSAISNAEERAEVLAKEHGEVDARKADENSRFVDVERERNTKLSEAERLVEEAQREQAHLESQRRGLRDKRKELERRQKAYLKNAEDNDRQAGSAQLGDARQDLRRSAEQHRKEAAALEPERQDIDRRLASIERPIGEATARLDAAKAELDAAKRSLSDAREGHTHRLAELDAEQKRKSREISLAEAEIQRRLVTLGTLVNLNRIEDPQFAELYQRIDRLRGAITSRTTEIEKLTGEREAYDRGTLTRGLATIGGAIVALIALIVILRAII